MLCLNVRHRHLVNTSPTMAIKVPHTTCAPACCRYLLSQHPEVEARLLEELDSLELLATDARPQPRSIQPTDLGRLTYLQAIIKVLHSLNFVWPASISSVRA